MYKLLIQTKDIVTHTKSQIHHTILELPIKQQQTSPTLNLKQLIIQQIKGKVHLMRNLNTTTKQIISKLKSRAVFVINSTKAIQKFINERLQQIQNIDKIQEEIKIDNQNIIGTKRHIAIVFKSVAMAEQFTSFVNQENVVNTLIFYIKNITIIHTLSNVSQQNWKKILLDEQTGKQVWVQLPNCQKCLSILQSEVTGIYKRMKQQKQQNIPPICKVCWIRQKQQKTICSECSQIEDNWVCMICGTIGCGRYKNADAFKHYTSSKHFLSLDLKSNRIWNYKLDCFSHRVCERENINIEQHQIQQAYDVDDHDVQLQFWKYCNVVSQQLDKQRHFYNQIKDQEIQRYNAQQKILQDKIKELTKIKQQKKQNLKKKIKKSKKIMKKYTQLQQQVKQQKQLNKHLQQSTKYKDNKQVKQSQIIKRKKQELRRLEQQIEQALLSLTQG